MAKKNPGGIEFSSEVIKGHLASHIDAEHNKNTVNNIAQAESSAIKHFNSSGTPILEALEKSFKNPTISLHIPGHAGGDAVHPKFKDLFGQRITALDTTDEFNGLGKLHPQEGPVAQAQTLMAKAFGASKSFFLINGSTIGNLALALTVAKENKKIIIGRNCHRSVISGLTLTNAEPVWVIPDKSEKWGLWGAIKATQIKELLDKNPDAGVVWINNPTYEGIVSDIEAVAKVCRQRNVILIVDEAHGCLWKFNDKFPKPALECGADAVVHSLHKSGGSLSQSSVLHIAKTDKIDPEEIEANLEMLHSTSPSYMLLAGLDASRAFLTSEEGRLKIAAALKNAEETRKILSSIKGVHCLNASEDIQIDPLKIYLKIDGLSGKRLESLLEVEYKIAVEAATDEGILALSNIGNTSEDLYSFCEAVKKIAQSNYSDITGLEHIKYMPLNIPKIIYTPGKAYRSPKESVSPEESLGRISAEVVSVCPPGISILVPGEKITEEHLPFLAKRNSVRVMKEN